MCGTTYLFWHRQDGAPVIGGVAPAANEADAARNQATSEEFDLKIIAPIRRAVDYRLAEVGVRPLPANVFDSLTLLPDAYL